ncbi:MAG: Processive diacylglycerol beta-glucosyltransferase [bacterium]|nr:Processive diacylglycerol beta-glucosyltransferase [bacterium]
MKNCCEKKIQRWACFLLMSEAKAIDTMNANGAVAGEHATNHSRNAPRILLLCKSTGTGPRRGALAVALALRQLDPDAVVHDIDILQLEYAGRQRRAVKNGIKMQEQQPYRLARLYEQADKPPGERRYFWSDRIRFWQRRFRGRFGDYWLLRSFLPFLQSEAWDVIVNVGATGELIAALKQQGKIRAPQFLLTTDFYTHRANYAKYYAHYFVATEECAVHLKALGAKRKQISITGTPIHPAFSEIKERAQCLRAHGLSGDRPIVLQMTGGLGMGPVEKIFKAVLTVTMPLEVVVVAGRNQELKQRLEQIVPPGGIQHRVKILGLTDRVDELMRVADVLVSKSGGMTTAEALACGVPIVIIDPFPGLEAQNCDFLLENGVAIKNQHLETLPFQLTQLLSDSQRLAQMRSNARRLGNPQAAFDIARKILQWVRAAKGESVERVKE